MLITWRGGGGEGVYNDSLHGGLVVGRGFIMAHYMEGWWWGGGL